MPILEGQQIQAWVEAEEGEAVEGNYYAPDASYFSLKPSALVCPFCFGALELVVLRSHPFGRIFRDLEERVGGRTRVIVDLLPPTHEAFKCSGCEICMTQVKEAP